MRKRSNFSSYQIGLVYNGTTESAAVAVSTLTIQQIASLVIDVEMIAEKKSFSFTNRQTNLINLILFPFHINLH